MDSLSINSYAKINLGLDVTGVRSDGYHMVKMIMQNISLCDSLYFEKTDSDGIVITTNMPELPVDEKNIVFKAIRLFKDSFSLSQGVSCRIEKNIPVAAGMAGGSGNGAAALKALNTLFETGLSSRELAEFGLKLGADVPFCLYGKTALAEGIGEILTPLPAPPRAKVLIVKPPVSVSTAEVYRKLDFLPDVIHPDIDACVTALHNGSLSSLCRNLGNILEHVTVADLPVIADIKKTILELGALGALMSGSGPTVFGLFDDMDAAQKAYEHFLGIQEYKKSTFLCDFT